MPAAPTPAQKLEAFVKARLPAYSRKQTLDLQSAMAAAIGRVLRDAVFPGPKGKGTISLRQVFDEWPSATDVQLSPSACVRSPDPIRSAPSSLTPTLLEDTWEPQGQLGIGLYKLSEGECDFRVELRAASRRERSALVAGIDALFVTPTVLDDRAGGAQYGRTETMPEFWGLPVRLSRQESLVADDETAAKTNRWDAEFLVRAQAAFVRADVVAPFRVRIRELVDGLPG